MRKLWIVIPLLTLVMWSCSEEAIYDQFVQMPDSGWQEDSVITFDVLVEDTTKSYGVILQIRHNTQYPYQNIWLNRSISFNGEVLHEDKVNYNVAKPDGEWLGSGFGAIKTVEAPYNRNSLRFQNRGTYQFRIQQAMREDHLQGIEDLGLKIISVNDENNG